jgi:hypothetical protein
MGKGLGRLFIALHIFGIIGNWMKDYIGETTGNLFMNYGSYFIGSAELILLSIR